MGAFDHPSPTKALDTPHFRPEQTNGAVFEALAGLSMLSQPRAGDQQTSSAGVADMLKGFSLVGQNGDNMAMGVVQTVMSGLAGVGKGFAESQDVPPPPTEDASDVQQT
jgi:hypothetical protein